MSRTKGDALPPISIPAEHVDELRRAALSLYATKAEAIHLAANEYLIDGESLAPLIHHRAEFRDVAELLDQLDWRLASSTTALTLDGPANLLAELLLGALIGRLEALLDVVTPAEKGTALDMDTVAHGLDDARTLFDLLAAVGSEADH